MTLSGLYRSLFRRADQESDLSDELRSYLDLLTDEKMRSGMSRETARREAFLQLGGVEQVKEQVREVRAGSALDGLFQDVRHSLRGMRKTFWSTALAVLMLTLGIGATTLIFSIFYSVLLRPLPFRQPDRIVQLWETRLQKGWQRASFTEANFWDVRAGSRAFEELGAISMADWNLTGNGEPEHVDVGRVSSGFFNVLGVAPKLGRGLLADEDRPGHDNQVVLLGEKFWRTHFGGDAGLVGRSIRLDGKSFLVIGVLPAGEPWLNDASVFVPLVYSPNANRGSFGIAVIGRLAAGQSMSSALQELQIVCGRLAGQHPKEDSGMGVVMAPAEDWGADTTLRRALRVLLGAVAFLLLIACVNLANLLLARATARSREMTIRSALGASRARIVRLVLTESILLSLAGAGFGLLLAFFGLDLIKSANLAGIPHVDELSLNPYVLLFTLAAACATGLLAGIAPALQTGGRNVAASLRDGDRTQAGSAVQNRLRASFVTVEVALSLVLLIGAGLLLRSFDQLLRVDRGFQTEHRLVFAVNMPSSYDDQRTDNTINRFLDASRALPQVVNAAAVNTRPITGWDPGMGIVAADAPQSSAAVPWASWRYVSPDYFQTMHVPVAAGRTFTRQDVYGHPYRVVISQELANVLWPGKNPVGRQAMLWKGQSNRAAEVIGVVANMRERGLDRDPVPLVFLPYYGTGSSPAEFVIHTTADPMSLVPVLRARLGELDSGLPLSNVRTLDEVVSESLGPKRLNMFFLAFFAAVALLLAMSGIYGVLAYSVARRTPEIGLRVALGASRRGIVAMVIGQGMRPISLGIGIGLIAAYALSHLLVALLFDIHPADPVTYIAAALIVASTALLACLIPALRASRTDPSEALRQE